MGVFGPLSFWVSLYFTFTIYFRGLMAEDERKIPPLNTMKNDDIGGMATLNPTPPPPLLAPPPPLPIAATKSNIAPFRPSIAVIVGVLTTMFSITFLLLLYAKHCKRSNGAGGYSGNPNSGAPTSSGARKNSGVDRSVIESLPIFRFGSLRGQKEGLECAVCLTRFEPTEVLRLLPKCKHGFHVECVDTWLDAHSTCPLCRYRVDPEDVLLVEEIKLGEDYRRSGSEVVAAEFETRNRDEFSNPGETGFGRVSGRHSSAGEKTSHFLHILVQRPGDSDPDDSSSSVSRRSLDSASLRRKKESVAVGCFDRGGRKDGLLLSEAATDADRESFVRRFEHRIIVSGAGGFQRRWSDLQPSDMLFIQSEMIMTESGRYSSSGSRPWISLKQMREEREEVGVKVGEEEEKMIDGNGRNVINSRSVSEITGLSRFSNRTSGTYQARVGREEREARGAVKRLLGWASLQRSVRLKQTNRGSLVV